MMPDGTFFEVPHRDDLNPMERAMQTLFPQIKPYARHELAVEEPHVLYIDESGSPDGLPVERSYAVYFWCRRFRLGSEPR